MDKTGKKIQKRDNPNDVFITPDTLVEEHFNLVKPYLKYCDIVLDPCCHETQKYYKRFNKHLDWCYGSGEATEQEEWSDGLVDWCEITKGRDFFEYKGFDEGTYDRDTGEEDIAPVNAIVGNPPYSMIDAFLDKSIELEPRVISYLIGFANITTKRLEKMEKAGYKCVEFHLTKVFKWYGMSLLIVWVKDTDAKSVVGYDRKVHR